jgi:hypothetical protein
VLTTFLLDRARDELVLSFLEHLAQVDQRTKNTLKALAPASWALIEHIRTIGYGLLVPALRAAFERDLNELPEHLAEQTPDKQAASLMRLTSRVARNLRAGASPQAALAELATTDLSDVTDARLKVMLLRVGILGREYLGNSAQLAALVSDATGQRLFLTYFVADELAAKRVTEDEALSLIVQRAPDIMAMIQRLRELENTISTLNQRASSNSRAGEAFAVAVRQTTQVIAAGKAVLPDLSSSDQAHLDKLLRFVSGVSEVYEAALSKDYQQVVLAAVELAPDSDLSTPKVRRYLAFASALASAQSDSQLNRTLRDAALPVGSYRAKREGEVDGGSFSLTINSYVGVGAGIEVVSQTTGSVRSGYAAPALPVGVEASWAIPKISSSLSLFLPIIDLGAIASSRFKESAAVQQEPQLGFAQVLAPGAFVVLGISSSIPLSVGGGYQQVPRLRATAEGQKTAKRPLALFIAVDLPLFKF